MYPLPKRGASLNCLILPQNGVVDGRLHPANIAMGCPILTHSGDVKSSDPPKRPNSLEVTSTNGYSKSYRRLDDGAADGSLPCSPVLQSDSETEVLENDTRQLIRAFLRYHVGLSKASWGESKALATMKRVVEDVLAKHRYAYNGMINRLSLDKTGDDMKFISGVATSLFGDGTSNWGRIASLVAFGAAVCQYLKERGRVNCVDLVGEEISVYLLSHQREWMIKNNSWDGFVEFFRVPDPESKVRNTLVAFIGVAGIGATLALLSR